MNIDRNDRDERQTRLDGMIEEFRNAQAKRLVKTPASVVESPVGTEEPAASQQRPVIDRRPVTDLNRK